MAIIKKSTNNKCWASCGEKGTLVYCWWECKLVQPLQKTVLRLIKKKKQNKKLKIELLYGLAIPILGIYLKKRITLIRKDRCTSMFLASLFTVAKRCKQLKCPSTEHWFEKMWYICTVEYYSAMKRMEYCHLKQHGWSMMSY